MPNILDKITNTLNEYVADAKNIKGTYVVVNDYSELASLPAATVVEGSLAYCQNLYISYEAGFYQYDGSNWNYVEIINKEPITKNINSELDLTQTYTLSITSYEFWNLAKGASLILTWTGAGPSIYILNMIKITATAFSSTVLFKHGDKFYTAYFVIDVSTESNNATLSFQELQAGSGGGGSGTQDVSLIDSTISYALTSSDVDLANATSTLIDFTQAGEAKVLPVFQKARELLSANKLGLIRLTMQIADLKLLWDLQYASGSSTLGVRENFLLTNDDGYIAVATNKIVGSDLNMIISALSLGLSINFAIDFYKKDIQVQGSSGTGQTKTVYDFVVKDNNTNNMRQPAEVYFSIDEDSLNEAIEDINAFYGSLATLQGETYTNLTDANSIKAMFDYYTANSLADAVVAALNILVIKSQKAYIYGWDFDSPRNMNINDYVMPAIDFIGYTNIYFTGEVRSVYDCGVMGTDGNNQITADSIFESWFWSGSMIPGQGTSKAGFFTNSSSQTMTFTTRQEVVGGGSSGDGSVELKSNVYTLKFSSNNTYVYNDSNEETHTASLPMIWGITFESKDIVNRFNDVIDEFNSTSGTSISHITSVDEMVNTIKQIITIMIAGNMNNFEFYSLFGNMIVHLANGDEETVEELYSNSLNKLYRIFGSSEGRVDEGSLENDFLANMPIFIRWGMLVGFSIDNIKLAQLDIQHTGNYEYFCLKDTYELELINETPFEVTGSGSGSSETAGGSGKLYEINMELTRYDENGDPYQSNDGLAASTLPLTLLFYENNFNKVKVQINAILTANNIQYEITDIQSFVTFLNSLNETTWSDTNNKNAIFISGLVNLCDKAYSLLTNGTRTDISLWSSGGAGLTIGNLYNSDNVNGWTMMKNDFPCGISTNNSCTLTEYGTSGSGGGGSVQTKKWYTFSINDTLASPLSISNLSQIDTAEMFVEITDEQWSDFKTDVLSNVPSLSSIQTPQDFVDLYNNSVPGVGGGDTILALLAPYLVDYAMSNQSRCELLLTVSDGDGITLYPTSNIKGFGGTLSTTYGGTVYNWFDYITGSANSSMSVTEETETIGGGSVTPQPSQNNLCYLRMGDSGDAANVIFLLDRNFFDSQALVTTLNTGITQINTLFSISIPAYVTVDSASDIATYLSSLSNATYAAAKVVFYANLFKVLSYYSISSKLFRFGNSSIYPMVCQATADDQIQTYTYSIQYLDSTSSPLAFTTVWDNTQTFDFHIDIDTDNLV